MAKAGGALAREEKLWYNHTAKQGPAPGEKGWDLMIRISNLSLPVDGDLEQLRKRAAQALGLRPGQLGELEIVRQSIDARNRSEVHYVYTVELSMPQEERLVENAPGRNVSRTGGRHTPFRQRDGAPPCPRWW